VSLFLNPFEGVGNALSVGRAFGDSVEQSFSVSEQQVGDADFCPQQCDSVFQITLYSLECRGEFFGWYALAVVDAGYDTFGVSDVGFVVIVYLPAVMGAYSDTHDGTA
jgi:hypothetical protein